MGVFVLVETLLITAIVRFRARESGGSEPRQVHGHARLELAWTAIPALILVGVMVMMVGTMNAIAQPPPDSINIEVIGHQWWWRSRVSP